MEASIKLYKRFGISPYIRVHLLILRLTRNFVLLHRRATPDAYYTGSFLQPANRFNF